jgi:hypothetical protein
MVGPLRLGGHIHSFLNSFNKYVFSDVIGWWSLEADTESELGYSCILEISSCEKKRKKNIWVEGEVKQ